jgi:hypothetical protein
MPPFEWPSNPVEVISQFEVRHGNPDAGALFLFAVWAVDSLYYLSDIDCTHDLSQDTVAGHRSDVVEVAHARWATSTSITALDLCAAGLGRALCAHTNVRELAISDFHPRGRRTHHLRALLPLQALQWVDAVFADPRYKQIKAVRHALTHARVARHFTLPRQRLRIQIKNDRLDVPSIIDYAKNVATTHVSTLLTTLPVL